MNESNFIKLLNNQIFHRDKGNLVLDLNLFKEIEPELYGQFSEKPLDILNKLKRESQELFDMSNFKIINFEGIYPISELRAENLDKLVRVKGMITKATKVFAYVEESKWECGSCGAVLITQNDKKPTTCTCRNKKNFYLVSNSLRNLQEIEVEEPQDELEGKQPHKIRVRLFDDLTDKSLSGVLQPGNKVSILGIVEKNEIKKKNEETLFEYRVLALDLDSLDEQFNEEKLSDEDIRQIHEISLNDPLNDLSDSLAPSIYGQDEVKSALVLQMVGGVKKQRGDGSTSRERIHLLLIGDPGVAKTRLIKSVHLRMPKSYYISGDETSKAGLSAVVVRDEMLNQWALKVGALCKANDSILFIDEIDKMSDEDREALHTPMESGELIINKADIHTKLNSHCSICAVANPKDGLFDFDGTKTITQQINLPPPLMSRFDAIFIMSDKIDKDMDSSIANKIFSTNNEPKIPIDLFRKYISYARKQTPQLKEIEMGEISEFYHEIRKKSISNNSKMRGMPITPRHLEGLIRLSEASAKLRLSEFVTKEDINIAKEIFYNSLIKLGLDPETGTIDMARLSSGKTLSKKTKGRLMIEILKKELDKFKVGYVYDKNLKEKCLDLGISSLEYDDLIYELNKEGEIIKKEGGWGIPKDL